MYLCGQFVTQYQQAGGRYRLRSTTVCGGWQSDNTQMDAVVRGFDQEAAAVLMARIAVHRTETEEVMIILFTGSGAGLSIEHAQLQYL